MTKPTLVRDVRRSLETAKNEGDMFRVVQLEDTYKKLLMNN